MLQEGLFHLPVRQRDILFEQSVPVSNQLCVHDTHPHTKELLLANDALLIFIDLYHLLLIRPYRDEHPPR